MGKVRVVYRADGGISVIHPKSDVDYDVACAKAMQHPDLAGRVYDDIGSALLPQDRKYRDAWTGEKGKGISIDSVKKAEIDARSTPEEEARIRAKMRELAIAALEVERR